VSEVVDARILYWGVDGAGKSANLEYIHGKLRPDHRGDLQRIAAGDDPGACYELLPIELGKISGIRTRLQIVAPPGGPEHEATRQQLLDQVDGIVFVLDARRERMAANLDALEELRRQLERYGRALENVPVVLQYNRRDEADERAVEDLHRKVGLRAAAFEAIAPRGVGVLESLTTISKRVVRNRREAAGLTQPPGAISVPPGAISVPPGAVSVPPTVHPTRLEDPVVEARPEGPTGEQTTPEERTLPEESTLPEREEKTLPEATPPDSMAQAIDLAARRAERVFEEHWDQATGGFEARTGAPSELALRILGAGDAIIEDGRRLHLTLRLVDQDGREGDCTLTLDLSSLRVG
jgi:signal recognition particle receptor subunit beta